MSHWWRAHDEAVDDPKLCLLSDRAHRAWFNLMCLASANDGKFPAMKVIGLKLRMPHSRVERVLDELREAGLIDEDETGMAPHNWNGRQFKSDVTDPTNATRQKRYRDRHRNEPDTVTNTVTVTATREQITETDSETDSEKKSSLRSDNARVREAFDEFWRAYPHKVGKQAAYKAFVKTEKNAAVTFQGLMFALTAYVNKTDDRPWCNPATWLNEGRWDDRPAPPVMKNGQLPRPGSREDREEKTYAALQKLREHQRPDPDGERESGDVGEAPDGRLPFPQIARS